MSGWDEFLIGFDDEGHLVTSGREGWREPICSVCGDPIRWVLDMMSFTRQPDMTFHASHAACVWTPHAFTVQRRRAKARELAAGPVQETP